MVNSSQPKPPIPIHHPPPHIPTADLEAQAKVNSVLGWHGSTLRISGTLVITHRAILPFQGVPTDDTVVKVFALDALRAALATINNVWLADSDYVAGDDVSIADLQLSCEVNMLRLMDGAPLVSLDAG